MSVALFVFELKRAASRRVVPVALLLFTAALALGHIEHWRGEAANGAFYGYAWVIGAILLMRFGLAADRALRFDEYLVVNLVRPRAYVAAKAGAMGALLVGYALFGMVVEIAFTGGGVGDVAWAASAWVLATWLFAPLAMAVESWFDTSLPSALVLLVYFIVVVTEYVAARSLHSAEVFGLLQLAPGDWSSLGPLALRAVVAAPIGFVLVGALIAVRLRRY